jgi:dihydrolipoamide dehydrogenase
MNDSGQLVIKASDKTYEVDKVLLAIGRRPNIDKIGLEKFVAVNERGMPKVNLNTMKIEDQPHILLPGDVNADRPILHEAADEGKIAGYNAVNDEQCFRRRTNLGIVFSEPSIAMAGQRFSELEPGSFVTGKVSFEGQGRSIVKLKEQGMLHVYADKKSGKLLGAELHGPDAEHLAHLLAWVMSMDMTVQETLRLPFYHPVVEEGLRTALRDAAHQLEEKPGYELWRCDDPPIR